MGDLFSLLRDSYKVGVKAVDAGEFAKYLRKIYKSMMLSDFPAV